MFASLSDTKLFGITGVNSEIKCVEALKLSWTRFLKFSWVGLIAGLGPGLLVRLHVDPLISLMNGLAATINIIFFFSLTRKQIEEKVLPNQGIKNSAINSLLVGMFCPLIITISLWQFYGLIPSIIYGLSCGGSIWIIFGGLTCLQHFTLRLLLYQSKSIFWNYARFLNYSVERLLLQRVGGHYSFVNKLLQEHFAKVY